MKISRKLKARISTMTEKELVLVEIQLRIHASGIKEWSKYKQDIANQASETLAAMQALGVKNIELVHIASCAKCFATKEQIERISLLSGVTLISTVRQI